MLFCFCSTFVIGCCIGLDRLEQLVCSQIENRSLQNTKPVREPTQNDNTQNSTQEWNIEQNKVWVHTDKRTTNRQKVNSVLKWGSVSDVPATSESTWAITQSAYRSAQILHAQAKAPMGYPRAAAWRWLVIETASTPEQNQVLEDSLEEQHA